MEDYKVRMIEEYQFIKDKSIKLHNILVKLEAGTLDFEVTNADILRKQLEVMGQYLYILEVRAELEGIGVECLSHDIALTQAPREDV